jgi:hypothetical protein
LSTGTQAAEGSATDDEQLWFHGYILREIYVVPFAFFLVFLNLFFWFCAWNMGMFFPQLSLPSPSVGVHVEV